MLQASEETGESQEQKYEPYQHGLKPGTDTKRFTPLKHVNTLLRHFSREKIQKGIAYLNDQSNAAPIFILVDTRGTWTTQGGKLFWQANDGSTGNLELVPSDETEPLIQKEWYDQKTPSGIRSLWYHMSKRYVGVTQSMIRNFVKKQKPWQMLAPKFQKGKARRTRIAGRPFAVVSIDIADMVSFGQGSGSAKGNERYILVCVDNFSSFCFGEV